MIHREIDMKTGFMMVVILCIAFVSYVLISRFRGDK